MRPTLPCCWRKRARSINASSPSEFGLAGEARPASLPEARRKECTERNAALLAKVPRGTVPQFVDSIDYAVKKIGVDHVGIASDFNHGGGVIGWDNEGEALNVTVELLRRGYSEKNIGKLWAAIFCVYGRRRRACRTKKRRVGRPFTDY